MNLPERWFKVPNSTSNLEYSIQDSSSKIIQDKFEVENLIA